MVPEMIEKQQIDRTQLYSASMVAHFLTVSRQWANTMINEGKFEGVVSVQTGIDRFIYAVPGWAIEKFRKEDR